jgi:hypothetical protein
MWYSLKRTLCYLFHDRFHVQKNEGSVNGIYCSHCNCKAGTVKVN